MDQNEKKQIIFDKLKAYCPDGLVYRYKIDKITGGFLNPNTMRNLDCLGQGVPNRVIRGRLVAYPIDELIKWMKNNINLLNFDN